MAESIFMKVSEVAKELGVSESYAYKLVRKLNKELEETGCIVRRYSHKESACKRHLSLPHQGRVGHTDTYVSLL